MSNIPNTLDTTQTLPNQVSRLVFLPCLGDFLRVRKYNFFMNILSPHQTHIQHGVSNMRTRQKDLAQALLAVQEKLEPPFWSWIAFPDTHRPMPHRQPPIMTTRRLMMVRNIFRQDLPYCPWFKNSQKMPLRPSSIPVRFFPVRENGMQSDLQVNQLAKRAV